MTSRAAVDVFFRQQSIAVVGVSRSKLKFGNMIYKELKAKEFRLFPVNPHMDTFNGDPCFSSLTAIPEPVEAAVVVVKPEKAKNVVKEAAEKGVRHIWMQQGSGSKEAVQFCEEHNISVVHGECILMFANPTHWVHGTHRWLWKILGKLPK